MADVSVEFGATDTGLSETLNGIRESMKNLETQQKTTAMSTDEVEKSLRELKKLQGMEKHFMALSGETEKLSESQMEAKRASEELAAAMKKAEEETRALAEEQKKAESITKANRTATEIYNQEIEELQKHLAAGRISMETFTAATAKADQRLSAATPQAKDLGSQIENVGDKTKKVGGIFDDEFKRMGAAFTVGNLAAEGFQKAISLAFDAARAVVRGFSDALDLGGRLSELSARTGEAAGTLLVLETAFKNSGLEASQVGQVINKLQNFMQDATNGGEKQTKVMRDLGISFADLAGKTPSDQMQVFAEKIAGIQDPTQRAATASEVFGEKLGGKLLPLLVDFSGNIDDARNKVGSLEQVMNENAATFDKFSESIDAIKGKMAAFAAGVLSETVPALQELGSEMEGIDAAKIGQEIGTILNPALLQLATILKDVTSEYGDYYNAVQSASIGNADAANSSKDATGMLDLLKAMMVSIVGPLNDLVSGTTNYTDAANAQQDAIKKAGDASSSAADNIKNLSDSSSDATQGIDATATAANDAQPALAALGDKATQAGDKVNTAFTLTADLKPELDSIGSGWGDISDKIQTGNSLLEGTGAAFGAIAQSTEEQAAGIGGINEQLTTSEALNKLILDLVGKTADKEADAAAKAAQKAADQAAANTLKQEELNFQLSIAEAQAAGDTERVDALTAQKKYAEDIQKALAAGLNPEQAALFATNMGIAAANSANIKQYDKDGNQLFFKAAENASKLNESFASATGFADTLSKMQEIKAMDKAANSAKAAREELKAMDKLLGTDLAQKSFPDLAKKLGVDKIGQTGEEQIRAVVTYFNGIKTDLSKNPIDSEKGQEKIRELVKFLGGTPMKAELVVDYQKAKTATDTAFSSVPTTLDADKSVKGLRDSVKDGIELDVAAKSGVNGTLDLIKTAVEAIKTAVVGLEKKLPVPALI